MDSYHRSNPSQLRTRGYDDARDGYSSDSTRDRVIGDSDNPTRIVYHAPKERFRLGYFDVICLVINRTIGTGIFNSPQTTMRATQSPGAALLLWCAGIIYCLSGLHVYLEYGLNVPRYTIEGVEQAVPRSGGDLKYLQYVYRKPRSRRSDILLSTCVFGIAFIALGNMAGNSISFATRVLLAAGVENPSGAGVRGIAIGIATLTCFIHAFSRRFGIWLSNVLAVMKILILLLIIFTAVAVGVGGLDHTANVISDNTSIDKSFKGASQDLNDYAHGFLAIMFSFSGFEQPNYVLGEISRPRRKFPVASIIGVSSIVLLYMAVNISYMVVVPKDHQINAVGGVALRFFELTLGSLGVKNDPKQLNLLSNDAFQNLERSASGKRIFNAFLAICSMGNIIVMTYTAARVKQEIAKEGIIPFPKFFAQSADMSVGRILRWVQDKGWLSSVWKVRWFSPDSHREKTPVGALVLHFLSCVVLIFATWGLAADQAYSTLTSLSSYVINGISGTFVGLGILILRFKGPPVQPTEGGVEPAVPLTWTQMTGKHFKPILSITCALVYTIGSAWPVVTLWVKPSKQSSDPVGSGAPAAEYSPTPADLKWFIVPTIGWSIVALGVAWFAGFCLIASYRNRKFHEVFVVEKKPEFEQANHDDCEGSSPRRGGGGLVMVHETVYLSWVGRETLRQRSVGDPSFGEVLSEVVPPQKYAGTDFEAFMHNN